MRPALKFVAANAIIVFLFLNIAIWATCLGVTLYHAVRAGAKETVAVGARRQAALPNYAQTDWALTHFKEFDTLPTKYVSYVGWRRLPFAGTTINIEGPYAQRRTIGPGDATKPLVYFFGGSTMWGTGADDANTIPSLFAQLSGHRTENFGETAYTAHQGLMMLIQLLQEGHRPDLVVFYDGANEVIHKCRSELTPWSHGREHQISSALKASAAARHDLSYMFRPLTSLADSVSEAVFGRSPNDSRFNCDTNPDKSDQIATNLLQDWALARTLVQAHGGKFVGILQPVVYFSQTKVEHIKPRVSEKQQFEAVYPRIKQKIAAQNNSDLHDFTGVLDKDEFIYIDFCHLSPNGNRLIAQKLLEVSKE